MSYKAVIWGVGGTFATYRNSIYREAETGRLEILGFTGFNVIYRTIDGYHFIEKADLTKTDFDIIIVAAYDKVLPDIYHEAEGLQIDRSKLLRASVFSLPDFDIEKYMQLRKNPVSIISWNCFGGTLYHLLDLPFSSPTINLYFKLPEFITMCKDLPYYMGQGPVFEKYAWNQTLKMKYPVMKIGGAVQLYANHYSTIGEFTEKWKQRRALIHYDNVLVVTEALEPDDLRGFEDITYRKICFTPFQTDVPGTIYLPLEPGKEMWEMMNESANGWFPTFGPIKLLLGEPDFLRCEYK